MITCKASYRIKYLLGLYLFYYFFLLVLLTCHTGLLGKVRKKKKIERGRDLEREEREVDGDKIPEKKCVTHD